MATAPPSTCCHSRDRAVAMVVRSFWIISKGYASHSVAQERACTRVAHSSGYTLRTIDETSEKKMDSCDICASRSSLAFSYGAKTPYMPYVRKQTMRLKMSCPGEPGDKKTGKHTSVIFRPHSKISNQ
eukprot:3259588-Prymnesium_polylepis.1